ncbi:CCE_0567 family metalloprotein [Sulfurimonas sp.]|uniref:CCE_0567 family metalloprotein n=1 Tax=Sulfurimonas sp. TaxID=2022749 RepID=UPI003D0FDF27
MSSNEQEKEIKKEYAGYKRKVVELAGEIHDIVEDTIWTDYERLLTLSESVQVAMKDVVDFKAKHDFLK